MVFTLQLSQRNINYKLRYDPIFSNWISGDFLQKVVGFFELTWAV